MIMQAIHDEKKVIGPLFGKEAIQKYVSKGRKWLDDAIENRGFPAIFINGRWESNTTLIDHWHQHNLQALLNGKGGVGERVNSESA